MWNIQGASVPGLRVSERDLFSVAALLCLHLPLSPPIPKGKQNGKIQIFLVLTKITFFNWCVSLKRGNRVIFIVCANSHSGKRMQGMFPKERPLLPSSVLPQSSQRPRTPLRGPSSSFHWADVSLAPPAATPAPTGMEVSEIIGQCFEKYLGKKMLWKTPAGFEQSPALPECQAVLLLVLTMLKYRISLWKFACAFTR